MIRIWFCLLSLLCLPAGVKALGPPEPSPLSEAERPEVLDSVGIFERLGESIPLDLAFRNEAGKEVELSGVFSEGRPVLLNLAYYECPMLCNLVLNGMVKSMKQLGWTPGEQYEVLTVSIDPGEGPELAAAKKKAYIENLGLLGAEKGWHFWTGEEAEIRALAGAVGFGYARDSVSEEYAHAAVIMTVSPKGRVSRYLYGTEYKGKDLKLALLEAKEEKSASVGEKILLFCYRYDPESRSYVLFAQKTMRAGGFFFIFGIMGLLGALWYKDIKRRSGGGAREAG